MPLINITLVEGRNEEQKRALLSKITDALITSFSIKDNGYSARIIEIKKGDILLPQSKNNNHIIIEITCFSGRSSENKKSFYKRAIKNIKTLGENEKDVIIVIHDVPLDNWGILGGKIASEVFPKEQ